MGKTPSAEAARGSGGGHEHRRSAGVARDDELLGALSDPALYGSAGPVERRETHASWVFLAGRWALKIKKPVRLGFLDYSTLALRQAACREEVRVNRELGGDIYLGVRAIVRTPRGLGLAREDDPRAVEYAVQMRRFEESRTLHGLIVSDQLTEGDLCEVARTLACFHERAPRVGGTGPAQLLGRWQQNLGELEALVDPVSWRLHLAHEYGHAFLGAHVAEVEQRLREGYARDCHGDLRCEHVLLADGVRVLDRIEFDPALRHLDVGADLAFLWMDLQAHGQPLAAGRLLAEYREAGGHPGSAGLLCFHAAYWALVRAKVAVIAARSAESARAREAERLRDLAERLCWRSRGRLALILCGAPASGKSTLARELAARSDLVLVSSDALRKRLAGIESSERARPEHYSAEFTAATYAALGEEGRAQLARGQGVILDATCHSPELRAALLNAVAGVSEQAVFVHCEVSMATALARARARMSAPERISDATPEIVEAQYRAFQMPDELPEEAVLHVDCEQAPELQADALTRGLDQLMARASSTASP